MKSLIIWLVFLVPHLPKLPDPEIVDISQGHIQSRVVATTKDEDAALNGFFGLAPRPKEGEIVTWDDLRTDSVYCHYFTYNGQHYWAYFTVKYDSDEYWSFFEHMSLTIDKLFLFHI